jgi:hypothetical protein
MMIEMVDNKISTVVADKIGSATSPLALLRSLNVVGKSAAPRAGDVVVVRVLTDNATYNMLELPTGRLAKVNPGDVLVGVLGRRRALKGFVGDVPATIAAGDELHLLNLGGVIGSCSGHHSSLNDAIKVEVIGLACNDRRVIRNIADVALPRRDHLGATAPLIVIAGACMNSGKTFAATEIIQLATRAGLRVATASFLDCGLPSTVDAGDLAPVAKAIIARLNESAPDLIVIELGDGILGGYSVESVFEDSEFQAATAALIFCASDYVGAWGGIELFRRRGIAVDLIAGSVTDSKMGEDYIQNEFGVPAANARRNGTKLFEIVRNRVSGFKSQVSSSLLMA